MHRRLEPVRHRFRYRVFSMLVEIDGVDALARGLRLLSHNRFNLLSFHDRDHGPRDGAPLRPWVEGHLAAQGIDLAGGPIFLHCFPRLWGFVFNPLSLFFCYHADGRLLAVLHEVKNTFGQQHGYLLAVDPARAPGAPILQACAKRFHVSPFIEMEAAYRFRLHEPEARLSILIRQHGRGGEILVATHTARRRPLSDGQLLRAVVAHPLMTFKVVAAIHWEALRLWLKGARYRAPPAPPAEDVSDAGMDRQGAAGPGWGPDVPGAVRAPGGGAPHGAHARWHDPRVRGA